MKYLPLMILFTVLVIVNFCVNLFFDNGNEYIFLPITFAIYGIAMSYCIFSIMKKSNCFVQK